MEKNVIREISCNAKNCVYNEDGQKTSQEEAHTREIVNSEGKVVCSYLLVGNTSNQ